jgi:hypothetical protein
MYESIVCIVALSLLGDFNIQNSTLLRHALRSTIKDRSMEITVRNMDKREIEEEQFTDLVHACIVSGPVKGSCISSEGRREIVREIYQRNTCMIT